MKNMQKTKIMVGMLAIVGGLIFPINSGWSSSLKSFSPQDVKSQQSHNRKIQQKIIVEPIDSLRCDHERPYFTRLRPSPNKKGVDRFPLIRFTANDDDQHQDNDVSGIDTSAVFITVKAHPNSIRIIKARPHLVQFRDGFFSIDYDFTLPDSFNYGDTVWVKLEATDLSKNKNYGTRQYKFFIQKDPYPPQIEVVQPTPFSTEVPLNTPLVFYVWDNKNMLDQNSAELIVNNQVIPWDKLEFVETTSGDTIRYQPETPFSYNDHVEVAFRIADIQENWADTTFWFDVIKDRGAPLIVPIRPLPDETEVS